MTSPDAPRRWHSDCRDIWPDDPAKWCAACTRETAMDFPRLATLAEMTAAAREAYELWREREATSHAR